MNDWWNDNISPLLKDPAVAGVAGSIFSLKWVPGDTYKAKFFALFAGAAVSIFGTKAILSFFNLQALEYGLAMAFLVGCFGPNLLGKLWDFLSTTSIPDLINIFRGNKS